MTQEAKTVRLQRSQRARAADALTRAFQDDPMWSCVLPDAATRAEAFRPIRFVVRTPRPAPQP